MSDKRCKNGDWAVNKNPNGKYSYEAAQAAILMDIRDELQTLNRLLGCRNFIEVPAVLRAIKRNTTKRKPKRAKP